MSGTTQIGVVFGSGTSFAAMWQGNSSSHVSLHPTGMHGSEAFGSAGDQQVGYYRETIWTGSRAVLWRGNAASMVELHPQQYDWSQAYATDGSYQGGAFHVAGGGIYAAMWNGTAESFVNMNPPNSGGSEIHGMSSGVQVGFAYYPGMLNPRATVWTGAPGSAININPTGAARSQLYATTGTAHVGGAWYGGLTTAALWLDSSPNNVINLSNLLPVGYGSSNATGIVEHKGIYHISGWASYEGRNHAILWIVPAPASILPLAAAGIIAMRRRR